MLLSVAAIAALCFTAIAKDLLMVDDLLTSASLEPRESQLLGLTYDIVTSAEWRQMHTKDFSTYKAIILSDQGPGIYSSDIQFLAETAKAWGPAITGNIVIHGTDSSNHYKTDLISNSIRFAAAGDPSSKSHGTGLYFSLTRYYDLDDLSQVEALSYFGNFTVRGNLDCYNDVHVVASSPAIQNLTDEYLSDWSCSVHEAFVSYPSTGKDGFQALAIADGITGIGTQNFANGHYGLPYIISRGATPAGCGDGHWDQSLGEECDDGNTQDGDGCSRSCKCESGRPKGDGTCYSDPAGLIRVPGDFHDIYYFSGVYSSVIIAVLFKSLWGIVVASTKMIEPFHQLYRPGGASAQESLLSGYLGSIFATESLSNIFRKQWSMVLTILVFLIATLNMLAASEFMHIASGNTCTTPDHPLQCNLQWTIDVRMARAMQACFALCGALILVRIVLGRRRTSGVSSYPGTIAFMSALLNSSPDLKLKLQRLEPDAKISVVEEALSDRYYALRHHQITPNDVRYGIIPIEAPENNPWKKRLAPVFAAFKQIKAGCEQFTSSLKQVGNAVPFIGGERSDPRSKPKRPRSNFGTNTVHGFAICIHLILLAIFLYYRFNNTSSKIFLQKSRIGPRFVLNAVAILLGFYWDNLEREVRIITPWRRLTQPRTDSKHVIEMSLHGVPITTFLQAIWRGNFYHALVAGTAILSDCLCIAIIGIPYNLGVIQNVSLFSSNVCIGLLGIMILTALSIFWWRSTNPALPREVDTIANMALMLCGSKMLQHFDGVQVDTAKRKDLMDCMEGRQFKLKKVLVLTRKSE